MSADCTVLDGPVTALGEGPYWSTGKARLLYVDILGRQVIERNPYGPECRQWQFHEKVSAAMETGGYQLVVPGRQNLWLLQPEGGSVEALLRLPGEPERNRCNDAKCDAFGNLWFGTMDDEERRISGSLWMYAPREGFLRKLVTDIGIPNTLAWDVGRGRFYLGDSMRGRIYAFDYDPDGPRLSRPRIWADHDTAPGTPDGSALDEDGGLWNARWGAGCVVRYDASGKLDTVLHLPAQFPTSCAFGGADGNDLFVTTAAAPTCTTAGEELGIDGRLIKVTLSIAGAPVGKLAFAERTSVPELLIDQAAPLSLSTCS